MTQRGAASRLLMEFLLENMDETCNLPTVQIYRLIVRLEQMQYRFGVSGRSPSKPPEYYLVTALLPAIVGNPATFQDDVWRNIHHFNSCYFIFTSHPRAVC